VTNRFTRSIAGRCGAVFLVWSAACGMAGAAGTAPAAAMTLSIVLPAHRLAPLTERVMKKELVRIWTSEGVRITWRNSEAEVPPGDRFVRVTLMGDEEPSFRNADRYVLGDFLPNQGRIRVSMLAASQAAANSSVASRQARQPFAYPLALGYILGRAIAHEVGHALLGTEHADTGLMQAAFNPRIIAESPSDLFHLTLAESARLARGRLESRIPREPATTDSAALEGANDATVSTR
jgi:hypothetical protein